jgi:hypothetical protein
MEKNSDRNTGEKPTECGREVMMECAPGGMEGGRRESTIPLTPTPTPTPTLYPLPLVVFFKRIHELDAGSAPPSGRQINRRLQEHSVLLRIKGIQG